MAAFNAARRHSECAICFEPMHVRPVGSLLKAVGPNFKRSCKHFFHTYCVSDVKPMKCPICRENYKKIESMPDPRTHPIEWFRFIDTDGSGRLSFDEIIEGLNCVLPIESVRIHSEAQALWQLWDTNKDHSLSIDEFMAKKDSLLSYLLSHFSKSDPQPKGDPPTLSRETLEAWFQYWDENDSNSLDKSEVVRALIKTLRMEQGVDVAAVNSIIDATWFLFDGDGNGTIDIGEFVKRDSLGDTLLMTLGRA